MSFSDLLKRIASAVENGDGEALAACFTENGTYHDYVYGMFQGREAIIDMVENYFNRDAEAYKWEMIDPVSDGKIGYATYRFSFTSTMPISSGKRVVLEGIGRFELGEGGLVAHYSESANGGIAMSQLGIPPEKMAQVYARLADKTRAKKEFQSHLDI
ncbi:MAG: nuclear transport factor 2 family protein [Desulfatiglans sp.]|jgi:ketosteroid isomerase-like protein|nr:nuclear transport factor 2 family protein [Thermodesulfobacteriota bacterium]MEE4352581.1 nuclear transport factor 2 family protein [Desulfatiglans sp.]